MTETRDKLIIETELRGAEQAKAGLKGVQDGLAGVSRESERTEKSTGGIDSKFAALERRFGTVAGQAEQFAKIQKTVNDAVAQNPALQARANDVLANASARLNKVSNDNIALAKSTGLARHELINLSRQAQDVGVSLASGQSPLTVLVQQGSQIADVFASSGGTVRGFFSQATGWATRFATSTAGVVTGVAAITTGVAAMAASWSSAQREIDKALSTPGGAASGVSRSGIGRIAEQGSSSFGLSVSEAREAATAFASTGKIYEDNILRATQITKQFALAMGIDVGDAAKKIAQDLQSPSAAASEWAKKIVGIDADTVNYIRTLENMGNRQAAITALIAAATPGLQKQAEQVGLLGKAYDFAANSVSDWWERQKRNAAAVGDFATGSNMFGSRTDEERLATLQERRAGLERSRTPGLDAAALRAVNAEIDELNKKLAETGESQRFKNLSNEVDALARSINTTETQIDSLGAALQKLEEYQATRRSKGMEPDAGAERAAQSIRNQIPALIEAEAVERRRAGAVADLVMKYGAVSTATALALSSLEGQLNIARQTTEATRMKAEEEARYSGLVNSGVAPLEAQRIAAAELAVKQAEATANVERQTQALRDQNEMIRARQNGTEATTAAAIAYRNAIDSGADATAAAALRAETLKNHLLGAAGAASNISIQLDNLDWSEFDASVSREIAAQNAYRGYMNEPSTMGANGSSRSDFEINPNPFQTTDGTWTSPDLLAPGAAMRAAIEASESEWGPIRERHQSILDELNKAIEEQTRATEANTEAITVGLNPLYTQGRGAAIEFGYMHAAKGLDFIAQGPTTGDQVHVPLKVNGGERVIVQTREQQAASNDNSRSMVMHTTINVVETTSSTRRSSRQVAQKYGQLMASLANG